MKDLEKILRSTKKPTLVDSQHQHALKQALMSKAEQLEEKAKKPLFQRLLPRVLFSASSLACALLVVFMTGIFNPLSTQEVLAKSKSTHQQKITKNGRYYYSKEEISNLLEPKQPKLTLETWEDSKTGDLRMRITSNDGNSTVDDFAIIKGKAYDCAECWNQPPITQITEPAFRSTWDLNKNLTKASRLNFFNQINQNAEIDSLGEVDWNGTKHRAIAIQQQINEDVFQGTIKTTFYFNTEDLRFCGSQDSILINKKWQPIASRAITVEKFSSTAPIELAPISKEKEPTLNEILLEEDHYNDEDFLQWFEHEIGELGEDFLNHEFEDDQSHGLHIEPIILHQTESIPEISDSASSSELPIIEAEIIPIPAFPSDASLSPSLVDESKRDLQLKSL